MVPVTQRTHTHTHSEMLLLGGTIRLLFSILYFIVILLKTFFFFSHSYINVYEIYAKHTHIYTTLFLTLFLFCHSIFQNRFCTTLANIHTLLLLDYYNVLCFLLLFIYFVYILFSLMPCPIVFV